MEKITQVTEADVGRVAVSRDGHFRVKILKGANDESQVQFLKKSGTLEQGQVSMGFGLVNGARTMYWEEPKSLKGFWFETAPAIRCHGEEAVNEVLRAAFETAENPSSWKTFEAYLANWAGGHNEKGNCVGIDDMGKFNGWRKGCILEAGEEILSFGEFKGRLGVQSENVKEKPKTPFTQWCRQNGYDPDGEFVFDKGETDAEYLNHMFSIGDVLQLILDDGSLCPRFTNQDGATGFEYFQKSGHAMLKAKTAKGPAKPRFHKPRQKPPVRKKTDVVIQYKSGEVYTLKNVSTLSVAVGEVIVTTLKDIGTGISVEVNNVIDSTLVGKLVVKAPDCSTEIHSYGDDEFLIYFENGYSIASKWFKRF